MYLYLYTNTLRWSQRINSQLGKDIRYQLTISPPVAAYEENLHIYISPPTTPGVHCFRSSVLLCLWCYWSIKPHREFSRTARPSMSITMNSDYIDPLFIFRLLLPRRIVDVGLSFRSYGLVLRLLVNTLNEMWLFSLYESVKHLITSFLDSSVTIDLCVSQWYQGDDLTLEYYVHYLLLDWL